MMIMMMNVMVYLVSGYFPMLFTIWRLAIYD